MQTTAAELSAAQQIEELLRQWANAVRHNDKASIWRHHDPGCRIFDALPPFEYHDLQAYRDNWDSWQPPFARPPLFELRDLQIFAGDTAAFAHCALHCQGRLENGTELDDRVRATFGLIRRDGRWYIDHQHISAPLPSSGGK